MNILLHGQELGPNSVCDLVEHNDTSGIAGQGLIAKVLIPEKTFLVAFGGTVMWHSRYKNLSIYDEDLALQVDDHLFLGPKNKKQITYGDHVNHSCDPNCGIFGPRYLVSRRTIYAGEELTFDYAMSESILGLNNCQCRTSSCRGDVFSNDWKDKAIQETYGLLFSTYLLKHIRNDPSLAFNDQLFKKEVQLGNQIKELERYYKK